MKVTISTLMFLLCSLNASHFLSQELLERSLEVPAHLGQAVGTLFVTDATKALAIELESDAAITIPGTDFKVVTIKSKEFHAVTGTCVAIGPGHFLTSSNIFELLGHVGDCFISMAATITEADVRSALFLEPPCQKVQRIDLSSDGKLVILALEIEEDLDVTALPLGVFDASQRVMGISTACPALLGSPVTMKKHRHTFSFASISEERDRLEALFVLPITVTLHMIRDGAIPAGSVRTVGRSTSIFANGDCGAPLLQDGRVVAICSGWNLHVGSLGEARERVHVLANELIPVAPYITWISDILGGKVDDKEDRAVKQEEAG